jgi:hypothetical protein
MAQEAVLRIYKDTPKEILTLLLALDFSQIHDSNKDVLLDQLESVLVKFEKYIPLRSDLGESFEMNIPGSPARLGKIINNYHWSKISFLHKTIALPFIKNWFRANLPTKKGVTI